MWWFAFSAIRGALKYSLFWAHVQVWLHRRSHSGWRSLRAGWHPRQAAQALRGSSFKIIIWMHQADLCRGKMASEELLNISSRAGVQLILFVQWTWWEIISLVRQGFHGFYLLVELLQHIPFPPPKITAERKWLQRSISVMVGTHPGCGRSELKPGLGWASMCSPSCLSTWSSPSRETGGALIQGSGREMPLGEQLLLPRSQECVFPTLQDHAPISCLHLSLKTLHLGG